MSKTRTRLIKIGTTEVICIPPRILKQLNLPQEVELEVISGYLVIRAVNTVKRPIRHHWNEQFRLMAHYGDDQLLDDPIPETTWDETEWVVNQETKKATVNVAFPILGPERKRA